MDSTSPKKSSFTLEITPRLSSTGHFPYTGSLLNHHLNTDMNIFYQKNKIGGFIFKSIDLEDLNSDINYLQLGVFHELISGPKLKIVPWAGYVFLQNGSFSARGSDWWTAMVITYKPAEHIKFQNTALVLNLSNNVYERDLTNRLEIKATLKPLSVSWFIWHNTKWFNNNEYLSTALAFYFPKQLSKSLSVEASVLFHSYITNAKPGYAFRRGVIFTISTPISFE